LLAAFHQVYEDLKENGESSEVVLAQHFRFWVHRGLVEYLQVYGGNVLAVFTRHVHQIFPKAPVFHLGISEGAARGGWTVYGAGSSHAMGTPIGMKAIRALLQRREIVRLHSLDLSHLRLGDALGTCLLRMPSGFQPTSLLLN